MSVLEGVIFPAVKRYAVFVDGIASSVLIRVSLRGDKNVSRVLWIMGYFTSFVSFAIAIRVKRMII